MACMFWIKFFFQAKEILFYFFLLPENSEIPPQLGQPESRPISRIAKYLDKICQLSTVGIVVYGSQGGGSRLPLLPLCTLRPKNRENIAKCGWAPKRGHFFVHIFQQKIDKWAWLSLSYSFEVHRGNSEVIITIN